MLFRSNDNEVSVVVTNNTLTLGVKLEEAPSNEGYWCLFDDFTLYYEGADASVLSEELNALIANAETLAEQPMCEEAKASLTEAIDFAKNAGDNALTAISNLNDAMPIARTSIEAYKPLATALSDVEAKVASISASPATQAAFSAVYDEVESNYSDGKYANDEISEAIDRLNTAVTSFIMGDIVGSDEAPADVTLIMINPDMTEGTNGWTGAGTVSSEYTEMEQYNNTFDTYQIIKGVKNGTYRVTVQGYYRAGLAADAAAARTEGTEQLLALLYTNSHSSPIMSVIDGAHSEPLLGSMDEVDTWPNDNYIEGYGYIPNSLEGAREHFNAGKYNENETYAVVTDNTIKVGIKKDTKIDSDWTNFTNFKLYYLGENSTTDINSTTDATATPVATAYYSVNGTQNSKLVKGINIVKTTMSDGSVKVSKVFVK